MALQARAREHSEYSTLHRIPVCQWYVMRSVAQTAFRVALHNFANNLAISWMQCTNLSGKVHQILVLFTIETYLS
jgi:hypothetical protein